MEFLVSSDRFVYSYTRRLRILPLSTTRQRRINHSWSCIHGLAALEAEEDRCCPLFPTLKEAQP
jgi:hypothetical protein